MSGQTLSQEGGDTDRAVCLLRLEGPWRHPRGTLPAELLVDTKSAAKEIKIVEP